MANWIDTIPIVGNLLETAFGWIDKAITDKDEANSQKAETARALFSTLERGGWFERNWRGMAMLFVSGTVCYGRITGAEPDWIFLSLLVVGLVGYRIDKGVLDFITQLKQEGRKVGRE